MCDQEPAPAAEKDAAADDDDDDDDECDADNEAEAANDGEPALAAASRPATNPFARATGNSEPSRSVLEAGKATEKHQAPATVKGMKRKGSVVGLQAPGKKVGKVK